MKLALIRHGATEWNAQARIQGHADIPLSAAGIEEMSRLLPPEGFETARVFTSPLQRAIQTAELLGLRNAKSDPRLREHFWGEWEGLTYEEIFARDGKDAFVRAGLAHDFCPKGGESTRAFTARVGEFLTDVARDNCDAIAVAHRGVMRSAYALATGWPMTEPMPPAMDVSCALILELKEKTPPKIAALNVPLRPRTA